MAEGGNLQVVADSLEKARKYNDEKNYGRSFAHYLVVFQLLPANARKQYEKEFSKVLHLWGSILHHRDKFEDVFRCYNLAITYFPTSAVILNNLGVHTLQLKCLSEAKRYFEIALESDPNLLPAEVNLQSAKYGLVERWHFPMLNDIVRNKAYAQAIFTEISHGYSNILDVGTGTGILSLFASKSKQCKSITACDYSDTMFQVATKVLEANHVNNINLVNKSSSTLVIPKDMKKKATLLVTEILDCGVFGENILETLIYAWNNLLNPFPYAKVIPAGVSVFVTGIQSTEISRKVRLLPRENNILKINEMCLTYSTVPYDSENLKTTNVSYVTETGMALFVDFNNVQQLKSLSESEDTNPNVVLKCTNTGRIDAFAIWFTLHLNDTISLTNSPKSSALSCWDQAVSHLRHPFSVAEGEELNIKLSCFEGYVEVECAQRLNEDTVKDEGNCYLVPQSIVLFLNDTLLLNHLEDISKVLLERFANNEKLTVLDISPFPILGLLLVKHGACLTCRVEDESVNCAIKYMCELNHINQNSIKFVYAKDFNDYTNENLEFDVIFQNLVNTSGLLEETELYHVQLMNYCLSSGGVYLPRLVTVWAQIVECDWLNNATRVDDKNVCGFKIAQFINEYKSTDQRDMDFNTIHHTSLSDPINLGSIQYNIEDPHINKVNVPIVKSGCANAVFYWFEIELINDKCVTTRRDESFVNNAAFMLDPSTQVNSGEIISLALKQHQGIMKIFISKT